jgi:hypothetical protein
MLLIDDFLGRLVAVETEASTRTFHNDGWTETTEYAGLVILRRVKAGNNYIVWIDEACPTGWTLSVGVGRPR